MRFPKIIKNKKTKVEVTIYGKSKGGERKKDGSVTQPYPFYRVCWRVAGQRRMQSFRTYSEAKKAAENLVRDLGSGSQVTALTPGQAIDARAALERLQGLFQTTGKKVSLLAGISEYCEAIRKLNGHTLSAAVDGFLSTVATVKRIDLEQAVGEFIKGRAHKTKSENGKRPQLSAGYHYIVSMWLKEFAETLTGTAVCDLNKELVNAYMASHSNVTARTRNGRRAVLGMFLKWCVREDYLAVGHRLLEANGMVHEKSEPEAIEFYTPTQLSDLLQIASDQNEYRHLLPMIALCGLAGLRVQEAARITYEDLFRVEGHVEISRTKSKTRARRLVTICPALAQWLAPYRESSGPIWTNGLEKFHSDFGDLRTSLKIKPRRNGLRHAFCTYHFAKCSPLVENGPVWKYLVDQRRLDPQTIVAFDIRETVSHNEWVIVYPYWAAPAHDSTIVEITPPIPAWLKFKNLTRVEGRKKEWTSPQPQKSLFGVQLSKHPRFRRCRDVLICEGEKDAVAWASYGCAEWGFYR